MMKKTVTWSLVSIAAALLTLFTNDSSSHGLLAGFNKVATYPADRPLLPDCSTPVASIDSVEPVCSDADAIALRVSPAGGTLYGAGLDGPLFSPASGTQTIYYVLPRENGCVDTANRTIIVLPAPAVSFTRLPDTICAGNNVIQLGGGIPAGGVFDVAAGNGENHFIPSQPGNYSINYMVTGANGCQGRATQDVIVTACPLGLSALTDPLEVLRVYPQPATSDLTVRIVATRSGSVQTSLADYSGRVVWISDQELHAGENFFSLDVSAFPRGLYVMVVRSEGEGMLRKKFVLQ